ncbi:MAG: glycosyltransferase family 4 protein [Spirochaetales bacterium]|uniref:Glycosyltransferase family 4 protein n=1 Tax=Candidatus Thalassospirochaeta sargassi TaxID=3119039 RepID=A0AAJ1IDB4_9SPIO|nr:glycosyltransferase family 4 protein [Spirochaetales bacterium]
MEKNIGFVSFRIAGTDGVSLEVKKWAEIFERNNCRCFYFAEELDTPPERSYYSKYAHFKNPVIAEINQRIYGTSKRDPDLTAKIHHYRKRIKEELHEFVNKFSIDVLIPQNAVTIPLNISLALALTEFIAETEIKTIAHHHDFFWERKRFLRNSVWDYFNMAYPPHLPSIEHVVINSSGQNQLALRTGISSTLIPNVMNFEKPAPGKDEYNADILEALGVSEDEILILQPTRVVQRKGIEHAIELVSRLGEKAVLVISHASGDEGHEYENRVHEYAKLMGIKAIFVSDIIDDKREIRNGKKIYTLQDIYPYADFVTYPSLIEGFGNAFLETIYFRKPILVNNYSIYSTDIKPKGFDVIEMDDFITDETVAQVKEVLNNPERRKKMVEKNYKIAQCFYSYAVLEERLWDMMTTFWGVKQSCQGLNSD